METRKKEDALHLLFDLRAEYESYIKKIDEALKKNCLDEITNEELWAVCDFLNY